MSSESDLDAPHDFQAHAKCHAAELKEGDWLSGTIYYKVGPKTGSKIQILDSYGRSLVVDEDVLQQEMISASQFDTEVKVSRTDMVNALVNAKDCVFTIKFRKQLTGKVIHDNLTSTNYVSEPSAAKRIKLCDQVLKLGELRTLTGYVRNTEHSMGRSNVIDLNVKGSHQERQVDHRTVEELILKRVKYTLK